MREKVRDEIERKEKSKENNRKYFLIKEKVYFNILSNLLIFQIVRLEDKKLYKR